MKGHRYDPDREWGGAGSSPWDDPEQFHAMNDYSAAAHDSWAQGEAPPAFDVADWRTDDAEPTHPAWSCQGCELHPLPEPEPGPLPDDYPTGPVSTWADQGVQYGDELRHLRPGRHWWNR